MKVKLQITFKKLLTSGSVLTTAPTSFTSLTILLALVYVAKAFPPIMMVRGVVFLRCSGLISCNYQFKNVMIPLLRNV